jgi:hypothetical protein
MKLNRTNVALAASAALVAAPIIVAEHAHRGLNTSNITNELSIFFMKCAFGLFLLCFCMEKEQ